MNRAILTVLLVLLIAASGGYIYYFMTAQQGVPLTISPPTKPADTAGNAATKPAGLQPGPIVSYTEYETKNTRVRAVVALRHIADTIRGFIPDEVMNDKNIPDGIRTVLQDDFANVLPYELALLGGSDDEAGRFQMRLFANQRYLAPLIPMVPQFAGLPVVLPILDWENPQRPIYSSAPTVIEGAASVAIPEAVAEAVSETWAAQSADADAPAPLNPISGDELLEISIDNREGALMAMIFSLMEANGIAYERFSGMQQFQIAKGIIADIETARLKANLDDDGTLVADVQINAVENASAALVTMVPSMTNGFALGMINSQLAPYDVTIEGKSEYNQEARAIKGHFEVKGFKKAIETQIEKAISGEDAVEDESATEPEAATAAPAEAQ